MSIANFDYKKMVITCLGPVHITDETGTVYSYQYLYDSAARRVYFLNERLWVKFLYANSLLEEFEALIKGRMYAGTLFEWLTAKGFGIADLDGAVTDSAVVAVPPAVLEANKMRLTEIERTVHSVDGQLYIPGSSIKGALRTGILFSLLLQEDKLRAEAWNEVGRILNDARLRDKNGAFTRLAQKLEVKLLHRLQIPRAEGGEPLPSSGMICSVMRGLSVSDTAAVQEFTPLIVQKREAVLMTKTGEIKIKNLNMFRECLPPGARQQFSITLDKAVFADLKIGSIDDVLQMQRDFIRFVTEKQRQIFGKVLKKEFAQMDDAALFLGSGSGFLSKTVLAALAPNDRALTAAASMILNSSFKRHAHLRLDKFIAPRAVQTAKTGADVNLMGLCALAEE